MAVVAAAADSEVGTKADGVPLFGGKGGDGFDNNVPLFIAWDSSAGKEKAVPQFKMVLQCFEGSAQNLELELSSVFLFHANCIILWLCHSLRHCETKN